MAALLRLTVWLLMFVTTTAMAAGPKASSGHRPVGLSPTAGMSHFGKTAMSHFGLTRLPVRPTLVPWAGGISTRPPLHHAAGYSGHHHHHFGHTFPHAVVWPSYYSFYVASGPYPFFGWSGTGFGPAWFNADLGRLFGPAVAARQLFGPAAVGRPLGVAPRVPVAPAKQLPAPPQPDLVLARPDPIGIKQAAVVRRANDAWRERGKRTMATADRLFRAGDYVSARRRYQDALKKAPDLAEANLKRGFAEAALGRFSAAVAAIRRAHALESTLPNLATRIEDLYNDKSQLTAHREALAQAALREPDRADLLFLLGAHFYFSAERDRAAAFFQRALQLDPTATYIRPFLPPDPNVDQGPLRKF